MGGKKNGLLAVVSEEGPGALFPEQLAPLLESELLRYLGGAVVGGTLGDIIQDVISGVIVEFIVESFVLLGRGELVLTRPSSGSSSGSEGSASYGATQPQPIGGTTAGPTSEVQTIGTILAILACLYVIVTIVRPKIQSVLVTREQRFLVNSGLAIVSAGVVAGGLFGLTAAVIASAIAGLAMLKLDETDLSDLTSTHSGDVDSD